MAKFLGFLSLCAVVFCVRDDDISINTELKINSVQSLVNINSHIVKIQSLVTIENTGKKPLDKYLFVLEEQFRNKLSVIRAQNKDQDVFLKVKPTHAMGETSWVIQLDEPLQPKSGITLEIIYALTHMLKPYPAFIEQGQRQLVVYTGNAYFYSPYKIDKCTTSIGVSTSALESYTKVEPVAAKPTGIVYGPYTNVEPFSFQEVTVHYENNSPFLVITSLERVVEVSHWGNIAVEEHIVMEHMGAKLKGPFSRNDFQRDSNSGISAIRAFKTILPADAKDVYYRDEIGNISTSNMYASDSSVDITLRPRFPLFGGWNTAYTIGYNLPSYHYLFWKGDQYLLRIPLIDHICHNMVVDEATIRVILPEGARNVDIATPYEVEIGKFSKHFTYLDIVGRPVVTLKKKNLVEDHIDGLEIRYTFPRVLMLLEPGLIVVFVFLLFLTAIVYVRLDFSLSKDPVKEKNMKLYGVITKTFDFNEKFQKMFRDAEDKMTAAKHHKNADLFGQGVKSFNKEYKMLITDYEEFVKDVSPEVADKSNELGKSYKQLKELYSGLQMTYSEKYFPGKIAKNVFVELEGNFAKKRDDILAKINKIVKSLE